MTPKNLMHPKNTMLYPLPILPPLSVHCHCHCHFLTPTPWTQFTEITLLLTQIPQPQNLHSIDAFSFRVGRLNLCSSIHLLSISVLIPSQLRGNVSLLGN